MKLQQLRYFCEVARQGLSVSKAASALHTSQPGVSKQLALLEAELNVHYTYPFLTRPGGKSALVLNVEHPDVASESLRRNLFTLLYQGDIAR